MKITNTSDGVEVTYTAREFESLAVFLAHFDNKEVIAQIGHDNGTIVNDLADDMIPRILSAKEIPQ